MGQTGILYRISRAELEEIEETNEAVFAAQEEVDVDKLFDPIVYLLNGGSLGRDPFVWLFMPQRKIPLSEDVENGPCIRYHDEIDIAGLHAALSKIDEKIIQDRFDLERINRVAMYPIQEEDQAIVWAHIQEIKALFQHAVEQGDVIIARMGY